MGAAAVTQVDIPPESAVARLYAAPDLADAYAIRLPDDAVADAEALARFVFAQPAPWVEGLMRVRDGVVGIFGLKTARQLRAAPAAAGRAARVGIFKVYASSPREVLLGEDDKHLDFRLSVLRQARSVGGVVTPWLVVSTTVHCHNRLGRAYILVIAPFHRQVVQSALRRAARIGWPQA